MRNKQAVQKTGTHCATKLAQRLIFDLFDIQAEPPKNLNYH